MESDNELLLGTWIRDPEDVESIRRFGNVKLHFTEDGQLIYTILGEEKDQKIFLTYRVENNVLITDQPSDPREERTNFRITEDGKLEKECSDGGTSSYIRDLSQNSLKASVQIYKTIVGHNKYNFAQFVGFYTAHMVWLLEDIQEGGSVSPLLAIQKTDEAWIERFESSSYECAAAKAKELYDTIPVYSGEHALLALDAFLTQADEYKEALIIQAFENREREGITYLLTIPYRSACSGKGLDIGQIKIVFPRNLSNPDIDMFLNNFKEGACAHTKGFEFWNNHRDCNLELIPI